MGLAHCPLTDSNDILGYFEANFSDWWLIVVSLLKLPSDECHWTWWRHQMDTFSALLAICAGTSSVTDELPAQRPATRSFDVFFDMHLNKRLSKQWWGWWFETPSRPLWRHHNEFIHTRHVRVIPKDLALNTCFTLSVKVGSARHCRFSN